MFVVVLLDGGRGLEVSGPFPSIKVAKDWARENWSQKCWEIVSLRRPEQANELCSCPPY